MLCICVNDNIKLYNIFLETQKDQLKKKNQTNQYLNLSRKCPQTSSF